MPSQILRTSMMPWAPGIRDVSVGLPGDPARFVQKMVNMTPIAAGYTARRGGYRITRKYDSPVTRIAGIYGGKFSGKSGEECLIVTQDCAGTGTNYQKHTLYSQWGEFDSIVAGGLGGGVGSTPDYLMLEGVLLVANPGRAVQSFKKNGEIATEYTIPRCSFLSQYRFRLFLGQLQDDPSAIAYSKASELSSAATEWRNFDYRDFPHETGRISMSDRSDDYVTGLADEFYGDIYAFTRRSINRISISGEGYPQREVVNRSVGCSGNQTIVAVGNDLIWCSDAGVHSLMTTQKYGDVESAFLSAPIQGLWNRIDPKEIAKAWATYDAENELYILSINLGQANVEWANTDIDAGQGMLVLHVPSGRWSMWSLPATCVGSSQFESIGRASVCIGSTRGGVVQVGIVGLDDNYDVTDAVTLEKDHSGYSPDPFDAFVETDWIDAGDSGVRKNYRGVEVYFRSGSASVATLKWQIDDKSVDTGSAPNIQRLMNSATFHLNPGDEETWIPEDDGYLLLNGARFFADTNSAWKQAHVNLFGSGNRIKLRLETSGGHRYEHIGWDLHYIPEMAGALEWLETGNESTVTMGAKAKGRVGGVAAGDGPVVPSDK